MANTFSRILVEVGLFDSDSDVLRWIREGKISVSDRRLERDFTLDATLAGYAIELHGKKKKGKYLLDTPQKRGDKYTTRGPI